MAEGKTITIVLKQDSAQLGSDSNDATKKANVGGPQENDDGDSNKALYAKLALDAAEMAIDYTLGWADYYWDRNLTLNDDYIGQRNKNVAMQCINSSVSFAKAAATYAIVGAKFGPWGAAIGAVVGAGVAAIKVATENKKAELNQDIQLKQIDASLNFTRQRSGWSTQAASIGEDL